MKSMKYIRIIMENGDTRVEQVKTTTKTYISRLIADIQYRLPAKVTGWEVLA